MNQREIMKMQQQMIKAQQQMAKAQEEMARKLAEMRIEGNAGGGAIQVIVSGDYQVLEVKIDPEAIDPEDVSSLEDLVKVAFASALDKATKAQEDAQQNMMSAATGGIKLPPGMGF